MTLGLRPRLLGAFAAASSLTILAGGVGLVSYRLVDQAVTDITDHALPLARDAQGLKDAATELVAATVPLANARSQTDRDRAVGGLAELRSRLTGTLDRLAGAGADSAAVAKAAGTLGEGIDRLDQAVEATLSANEGMSARSAEVGRLHASFIAASGPTLRAARVNAETAAERLRSVSADRIRRLVGELMPRLTTTYELRADANLAYATLLALPGAGDEEKATLTQQFDGLSRRMTTAVVRIVGENREAPLAANVTRLLERRAHAEAAALASAQERADLTALQSDVLATVSPATAAARGEAQDAGRQLAKAIDAEISAVTRIGLEELAALQDLIAAVNLGRGLLGEIAVTPDLDRLAVLTDGWSGLGARIHDLVGTVVNGGSGDAPLVAAARALADSGPGVIEARRAVLEAGRAAADARRGIQDGAAAVATAVGGLDRAVEAQVNRASLAVAGVLDSGRLWLIGAAGLSVALGAAIGLLYVGRRVVTPLVDLGRAMAAISSGRLDTPVPAVASGDEIGAMARALAVFRDKAADAEQAHAEAEVERERAGADRRAARLALADDFERGVSAVVGSLGVAADGMHRAAEDLSGIAGRTRSQSVAAARAADSALQDVQTVAAAAEQLSASIAEIGVQVSRANGVAATAVTEAAATNRTVRALEQSGQRIGDAVGMISLVAQQTKLLALNATIEAARAGEAGRGFTVVANEVKALAEQTERTTDGIVAQVSAVQEATLEAVRAIATIGGRIEEINGISAAISAAIEEQGAATQEIARCVQGAAASTAEASQTIVEVSDSAIRSGGSAEQVLRTAEALNEQAAALRRTLSGFLDTVRA
ncbi:methyl-accepting chemotaxis protein [Azospirillum sp.]|uniref:methyl-accepting chemotaxis protein n=1 Tax=Azospirillum sp. TaxID=34012 RepID=UPI00260EB46A|nr:methyl-accepting chemotaxis protein [Azospirillum sp.]